MILYSCSLRCCSANTSSPQRSAKIPQIHETPQVTAMRRKGIETEISRENDKRRAYNAIYDSRNYDEKSLDNANDSIEHTTEPQKRAESDLLAKAQASLQNRLQERLKQREQAKQAEQQDEKERQEQAQENQQNKQSWGVADE